MPDHFYDLMYAGVKFVTTKRHAYILKNGTLDVYARVIRSWCPGQRVVDVGGFSGETAVLFHHWGATHVTVVEGAPENIAVIQANLERHAVPSVLIEAFVGAEAGSRVIRYNAVDGGYGLASAINAGWKTRNTRTVTVTPLADILAPAIAAGATVVKCDCEGGEIGFTTCPPELIRAVAFYLVETHSHALAQQVIDVFLPLGYRATLVPGGLKNRPLYTFARQ